MNNLPPAFEERMKELLKTDADAFFQALQTESPVTIRFNPLKQALPGSEVLAQKIGNPVEWCDSACYLNERPVFTLDPCFHGGAYYVQEASSMFIDYILKKIKPDGTLRVLDLCAAPGGKSTLIASALSPESLLVSNEVIRSRASILKENIIRWGHHNIVITNSDPSNFSKLKGAFDLIFVDAPCSGEGMFRKDPRAIEEWSENNRQLCSDRQKRILTDIWDTLKPEGYLIYSTCTYNRNENEEIIKWLIQQFDARKTDIDHPFNNIVNSEYGYHFYPHLIAGEGFFTAVVQKKDGEEWQQKKNRKQEKTKLVILPAELTELLKKKEGLAGYTVNETIGVVPAVHEEFIEKLESSVRVIYKGCELAESYHKKLRLLHPLALYCGLDKEKCHYYEADLNTALRYLKKEDIPVTADAGEWVLIQHHQIGIGWGKSLGNRLNNYLPKELRIRMDIH